MPSIMLVSDDDELARKMTAVLSEAGFVVRHAIDCPEAQRLVARKCPHIAILDIDSGGLANCSLAEHLAYCGDAATIVISAHYSGDDVAQALHLGSDMFIAKPLSMRELVARVRTLLWRSMGSEPLGPDALILDPENRSVRKGGREIALSPKEFRLLSYLMRREGQVVTHAELLCKAWGPAYENDRRLLALYIYYLRQKIEDTPAFPRYIHTRPRIGYYLSRYPMEDRCPQEAGPTGESAETKP
ncbi:MAG TPA: response regulator transcription factor [Chloroflexi bacterium]|nr:response regulator transcription factor [Chloroflexota bacterium]